MKATSCLREVCSLETMFTRERGQRITMIVGDVLVLFLFVMVGRRSHEISLFAPHLLETVVPLVLSWLLFATATGTFNPALLKRPWSMVGRITLAWAIACPVGLVVRAYLLDRDIVPMFAVITFGMIWALLLIWRMALAQFVKYGSAQTTTVSNRHST